MEKTKLNFIVTGEELINLNVKNMPYLVEPIFQRTGVVALAGSSDTGKSSLLRQLAIEIVLKKADFIGFKINATNHDVIYISSEDDSQAMAHLLQKQKSSSNAAEEFKHLRYIFDTENILQKLEEALETEKADCVIIDTFTDMYNGDLNASNKVRSYLNDYSNLAEKYKCLIIFLHHTGKRTETLVPSKDNLLGSQGFEAKMRCVVELRKDPENSDLRHLCIVKGNYIKTADKEKSFVLKFGDNMLYENTNQRVSFHKLVKQEFSQQTNSEAKAKAFKYKDDGLSLRDIEDKLKAEGFAKCGRTAISEWLKNRPVDLSTLEDQTDGQEVAA